MTDDLFAGGGATGQLMSRLDWSATDVGPVIDDEARGALNAHVERLEREAKILFRADPRGHDARGTFFAPVIAEVLTALRRLPGCQLARMSGSGATCFGLFEAAYVPAATRELAEKHLDWWIAPSTLG